MVKIIQNKVIKCLYIGKYVLKLAWSTRGLLEEEDIQQRVVIVIVITIVNTNIIVIIVNQRDNVKVASIILQIKDRIWVPGDVQKKMTKGRMFYKKV